MPIRPATWGTREPTGKYVYSFIFYAIKYYYTVNFESTKLMSAGSIRYDRTVMLGKYR